MIYHQAPDCTFYLGDVRECLAALPEKSVQACISSPPYFGLRRYSGVEPTVWGGVAGCDHDWRPNRYYTEKSASAVTSEAFSEAGEANADRLRAARWREDSTCERCGAWLGCLGLERTPADFIAHLVEVFRSVWRVLRDDGTCFVNLGDSYSGSGKGPTGHNGIGNQEQRQGFESGYLRENGEWSHTGRKSKTEGTAGIPPKNLLLIPQRFAIAMQDDGWTVRSMIVWSKKSCMPESVTDRPTSAHEVIWMFTKRPTYYWDAEAVREQVTGNTHSRGPQYHKMDKTAEPGSGIRANSSWEEATWGQVSARNIRNVWLDPDDRGSDFWHLGPESFAGAHFATFPTAIPRRCILAATSEAGCCSACGKPWEREMETERQYPGVSAPKRLGRMEQGLISAKSTLEGSAHRRIDLGFRPSCRCSAPSRPCAVLDPFGGSGTTQVVARELGRHSIYIDASREYADMAIKRVESTPVALPLPLHQPAPIVEQLALEER